MPVDTKKQSALPLGKQTEGKPEDGEALLRKSLYWLDRYALVMDKTFKSPASMREELQEHIRKTEAYLQRPK